MLTLRVSSFNGGAVAPALEARFEATGGTIGRADDNDLVLPDSSRHISRLQARVIFAGGAYELADEGANAIDVNGSPLGPGHKARLRDGDRLRIGGYLLCVSIDAGEATSMSRDDPFASFGSPSAADPLGLGVGRAPPAQAATAARRTGAAGGIPDDFDPFAEPSAARSAAPSPSLPDELDLGLAGSGGNAPSIDAIFGLDSAPAADPFAAGALAQPVSPGRTPAAESLDPLAAFGVSPAPVAGASVPDQVPEVRGTFKIPRAAPVKRAPGVGAAATPGDAFLSWEHDASTGVAPRRMASDQSESAESPSQDDRQARPVGPPPPGGVAPAVVAASAPPPVSAAVEATAVAGDELARALAAGLGLERAPWALLDAPTLEQIGRLLREATQGTLDLLMARALTKREVRAEGTMIVAKDNNPLKFSPSVEAALAHLLAPQGRGFLPPLQAMRDAYDDLRSHQFGFMAGMRAALAGVLQRFDPAVLEQRLAHQRMLDSVLPIHRRAKLWDLYEQRYREIASEAEDDFHTLFGREFLRAYEAQVARLEQGHGGGDVPAPTPPEARR